MSGLTAEEVLQNIAEMNRMSRQFLGKNNTQKVAGLMQKQISVMKGVQLSLNYES